MGKRVKIQNLIKLAREGRLDFEVAGLVIRMKGAEMTIDLNAVEAEVLVTLKGDFTGNELHRELVRLGIVGGGGNGSEAGN